MQCYAMLRSTNNHAGWRPALQEHVTVWVHDLKTHNLKIETRKKNLNEVVSF